jgi:hypothetical protein
MMILCVQFMFILSKSSAEKATPLPLSPHIAVVQGVG